MSFGGTAAAGWGVGVAGLTVPAGAAGGAKTRISRERVSDESPDGGGTMAATGAGSAGPDATAAVPPSSPSLPFDREAGSRKWPTR
jgi:hypothetical protein